MAKSQHLDSQSIPALLIVAALFLLACSPNDLAVERPLNKITFDLSVISPDGLIGSWDSLRAVDYEFCIPAGEQFLAEILAIDPTIKHYPQSPGRIGCRSDQYLCIGNTHQPRWKEILQSIARLNYVEKIIQSDW